MTKLEKKIMELIAYAGEAKSYAFESIKKSRVGDYKASSVALEKGNASILKASKAHFALLTETNREDFSILLVHAEDQMMTSQMMLELAIEFIAMSKKINAIEEKMKI